MLAGIVVLPATLGVDCIRTPVSAGFSRIERSQVGQCRISEFPQSISVTKQADDAYLLEITEYETLFEGDYNVDECEAMGGTSYPLACLRELAPQSRMLSQEERQQVDEVYASLKEVIRYSPETMCPDPEFEVTLITINDEEFYQLQSCFTQFHAFLTDESVTRLASLWADLQD